MYIISYSPANRGNERMGIWSGEATRSTGSSETKIDITIGDDASKTKREEKKERPIWMTESTIGDYGENVLFART